MLNLLTVTSAAAAENYWKLQLSPQRVVAAAAAGVAAESAGAVVAAEDAPVAGSDCFVPSSSKVTAEGRSDCRRAGSLEYLR